LPKVRSEASQSRQTDKRQPGVFRMVGRINGYWRQQGMGLCDMTQGIRRPNPISFAISCECWNFRAVNLDKRVTIARTRFRRGFDAPGVLPDPVEPGRRNSLVPTGRSVHFIPARKNLIKDSLGPYGPLRPTMRLR